MKQQQGFTLIELIVVIVILGILAATALPKFVDLQSDARLAKMNGGRAAVQAGAALAHSAQLAAGAASNVAVTMEGQSVDMSNGYPTTTGILVAAGGLADYDTTTTTTDGIIATDSGHRTCNFTYTEATATVPASVSSVAATSDC